MTPTSPTERVMHCHVNRQPIEQTIAVHTTLADLLRQQLALTGTKVACDQGACGACTVLVDGDAVFSCHTLAAQVDGSQIETIEGLADGDTLHPLQQAFIDCDALQCGFCTPGMLLALKAAIDSGVPADRHALAKAISGNLCRCGAYPHILDAAMSVLQA